MLKLAIGEENARADAGLRNEGRDRATVSVLRARSRRRSRHSRFATASFRRRSITSVEDPECDLDYVPNASRDADVNNAVSNPLGFGGHNACVVFKRFAE